MALYNSSENIIQLLVGGGRTRWIRAAKVKGLQGRIRGQRMEADMEAGVIQEQELICTMILHST